jgi:hypothetical protein
VRGEVDGGHDAARAVADRRGDGDQALLELLVDHRVAVLADLQDLGAQRLGVRDRPGLQRRHLDVVEVALERVVGQPREEDAAHRRRVGGHARADVHRDRHERRAGDAHDVDHVAAVEDRALARLLDLGHEPLEVRERDLGERQRREVRVAQLEHPRRQLVVAPVRRDVAQVDEREEEAAGRRAGQAGRRGDLRDRQGRRLGGEDPDDREAALERLDEVAGAPGGALLWRRVCRGVGHGRNRTGPHDPPGVSAHGADPAPASRPAGP